MGASYSRIVLLAVAIAIGWVWVLGGDASNPVSTTVARAIALSHDSTASTIPVPSQVQPPAETDRPTVSSDPVDGYIALVPSVLRSGQTVGISVSLLSGQRPARGTVRLALVSHGDIVTEATAIVEGTGTIPLSVPDVAKGYYELKLEGPGFKETANLRVEPGVVLFVETDKPIYKPGQDIHIRVLLLDIELKPVSGDVTVEVQDAKGTKVFREQVRPDEYGMASLTMPLSTEPNLGVWKVSASSGDQEGQAEVRIERYVLPKYEINVDLSENWSLLGESITGTVSAEYSFGKPVRGELRIVASKYLWGWEEFAEFSTEIDGTASFELPATGHISSGSGPEGDGNVTLNVTVLEKATGYVEETTVSHRVLTSTVSLQLIPEGPSFKPSLPFSVLLVTDSPDKEPVDRDVGLETYYFGKGLSITLAEEYRVKTVSGRALLAITPPEGTVAVALMADAEGSHASTVLKASYSPSGSYVHLEQVAESLAVGDRAEFKAHTTSSGGSFHYEVISRGKVVLSDVSTSPDIGFTVSPVMAEMSNLVVYQVLPNGEVIADYLPFEVAGSYPLKLDAAFGSDEVRPGESVEIALTTQGKAKVGLSVVDRSVYILEGHRLNLQQVFEKLGRLYERPQIGIEEDRLNKRIKTQGAQETFRDAGLFVLTNRTVPGGREHLKQIRGPVVKGVPVETVTGDLADIERVRQFFPETWLWTDVMTDDDGRASVSAEAPDSITTWVLRAVGLSKEHGLAISEAQLRVFQPIFLQVDLPYSAIRGEEFSVRVAVHNYLDTSQEFFVELEASDRYTLLDDAVKTIPVGPNDLGALAFKIRLTDLGTVPLKVTARSSDAADAVVKELLVEPEGVPREIVYNEIVSGESSVVFANAMPPRAISGSARTHVALSGSYLSQTLEGLEDLLQMSYGCGEQNMVLFAPNVFVARYLEETGQVKPEVMARAEHLMLTGYQRQLLFRRTDGSFSTWGEDDARGSIWLTAFVLRTLAQAQRLISVDQDVKTGAAEWILKHQKENGSFEQVGSVPNSSLYGGVRGATALAAYVTIALLEAGEMAGADLAIGYLEEQLDEIDDPYTSAIVAYALGLGKSIRADDAYDQLLATAIRDESGLHWERAEAQLYAGRTGWGTSTAIENTGYAVLALLEHGDRFNAGEAARWLVSQRNAFGGYRSTQDTVVGLQALIQFSIHDRTDVDMTITMTSGDWNKRVKIDETNADVVQVVSVPVGEDIRLVAEGSGDAVVQVVHRFNRPEAEIQPVEIFALNVDYSPNNIDVNDLISVSATVDFVPPAEVDVGMVVLDIAIPTGLSPDIEAVETLVNDNPRIWRYDIDERKVVLYIEDLVANETFDVKFDARALHPIVAQPVTSEVYSYYNPQWRAESLGDSVTVEEDRQSAEEGPYPWCESLLDEPPCSLLRRAF